MRSPRIFKAALFFTRTLKRFGDMGWPMDYEQVGVMLREAAAGKGAIDWRTGEPFGGARDLRP